MNALLEIDAGYAAFCETLDPELRDHAAGLAQRLGLTPSAQIPWSEAFAHEVTLAAPALFAESMPAAEPGRVRDALLAHLLAVIEAFASDRVWDGQIQRTPALDAILSAARRERDRAIARVVPSKMAAVDFHEEAAEVVNANAMERRMLNEGHPVDFDTYERVSLLKQKVGFPATVALARASGWSEREESLVRDVLGAAALGLQLYDDVVDWEEDRARGGAWAVALARTLELGQPRHDRITEPDVIRGLVFRTGVLADLLERASGYFERSADGAEQLGSARVARWAEDRARRAAEVARGERESAGYAVRARRLSPWAEEVLA